MKYTLITGASGGIGWELARLFAADGHPLILVARSEQKLAARAETLRAEFGVAVEVLPRDLTQESEIISLFSETQQRGLSVDILVNNAGFGEFCEYLDADWSRQRDMVALNVTALMQLTHLYGDEMRALGGGRILNVASVAAMGPGPYMATYYATKAFVLSFSQAMTEELSPYGITVTALCPGPTATGFEEAAHLKSGNMFKSVPVESAAKVARRGYRATMRGKAIQLCGPAVWGMTLTSKVAPRVLARKFAKRVNGRPPKAEK